MMTQTKWNTILPILTITGFITVLVFCYPGLLDFRFTFVSLSSCCLDLNIHYPGWCFGE